MVCIGGGVMASAFAVAQASKHHVSIIPSSFDAKVVEGISLTGHDKRLGVDWPDVAFIDPDNIEKVDLIVIGVSSAGLDWAIQVAEIILSKHTCPVLLLTKGLMFVNNTIIPLTTYCQEKLGVSVMGITGPCIAKELANGQHSQVEISAIDSKVANDWSQRLALPFYDVIVNRDVIGCQWLAALKNVYAIKVGMASCLNAKSASFSDSLIEMAQWLGEVGADPTTAYGLSGSGDLYVTSLGGRNGTFGAYLAKGLSVENIFSGPMLGMTVEGYELIKLFQSHSGMNYPRAFSELIALL